MPLSAAMWNHSMAQLNCCYCCRSQWFMLRRSRPRSPKFHRSFFSLSKSANTQKKRTERFRVITRIVNSLRFTGSTQCTLNHSTSYEFVQNWMRVWFQLHSIAVITQNIYYRSICHLFAKAQRLLYANEFKFVSYIIVISTYEIYERVTHAHIPSLRRKSHSQCFILWMDTTNRCKYVHEHLHTCCFAKK